MEFRKSDFVLGGKRLSRNDWSTIICVLQSTGIKGQSCHPLQLRGYTLKYKSRVCYDSIRNIPFVVYQENHALDAWFKKAYGDEEKPCYNN